MKKPRKPRKPSSRTQTHKSLPSASRPPQTLPYGCFQFTAEGWQEVLEEVPLPWSSTSSRPIEDS